MVSLAILIINIGLFYLFLLMNRAEAQVTRIVTIEEFPYLGSLRNRKNESKLAGSGYLCEAALIHNRVLLTTAECIEGRKAEDVLGVVGATCLQGITTTSKVLAIATLRWHGLYKRGASAYNIGLAFADEDTLPIKGKLEYIPIAMTRTKPFTKCLGVGWAVNTDALSNWPIELPNYSASAKTCYRDTRTIGTFCTYQRFRRSPSADHDDSGIPITCNGKLAGVFILHPSHRFHVFTSVYAFRKWINGAIYLHFKKDPPAMEAMASMDGSICFQWLFVLAISIYLVG
ncbi:PREDICTED: uncharacterized protein LOC108614768 isoform X1 [Drosophila arizonae]|uniref:Uncharacterized protein LOC108614768 isoform X1 n=1 Tax=Drosophila arizonae TaxID=7263 RepID=A0ABM1PBB9_DROAR|nr:PREDICTED: uncharacterized protein LOC108614768 isoform X1 [Drosophila arizonae]